MRNAKTKRHYDFGQSVKYDFSHIVPAHVAETAAATCTIEVQGKESIGNEWGLGLSMRLQTFGRVPKGIGGEDCSFSRCGTWLVTHSRKAVNIVLNVLGYTVDDLLAQFGTPADGEKYQVDLVDIVSV